MVAEVSPEGVILDADADNERKLNHMRPSSQQRNFKSQRDFRQQDSAKRQHGIRQQHNFSQQSGTKPKPEFRQQYESKQAHGSNQTSEASPRRTVRIQLPAGWLRMLPAALLSCLIPWLILLALAVGTFFAASSNPWLNDTSWTDALAAGSSIWALGFGASLTGTLGESMTFSVVPLGLYLVYIWWGATLTRKMLVETRRSVWFFIPFQAICATLIGTSFRGPYSLLQLFFASAFAAFISVIWALVKIDQKLSQLSWELPPLRHPIDRLRARFSHSRQVGSDVITHLFHPGLAYQEDLSNLRLGVDRDARTWNGTDNTWIIPGWVISGMRIGIRLVKLLALVTLILVVIQVTVSFSEIRTTQALLNLSFIEAIYLWGAQLAFLPNFQVWGAGWLSGLGFAQGSDTSRSIFTVKAGPYPAVPIFEALPSATPGAWPIVVTVVVGLVAGLLVYLFSARVDLFGHIATGLVATLTFGFVGAWGMFLGSGGIGPGRMANWGVQPLAVIALLLLELCLPMVAMLSLLHPATRAKIASATRRSSRFTKDVMDDTVRSVSQTAAHFKEQAIAKTKAFEEKNEDGEAKSAKDNEAALETEAAERADSASDKLSAEYSSSTSDPTRSAQGGETSKEKTSDQTGPGPTKASVQEAAVAPEAKSSGDTESVGEKEPIGNKATPDQLTLGEQAICSSSPVSKEKTQANEVAKKHQKLTAEQAFARSRGVVPLQEWDTDELEELAGSWAKRKVKKTLGSDVEAAIKPAQPDPNDPDLPKATVKKSLFKRHHVKAGRPRREADETRTQTIELAQQKRHESDVTEDGA